MLHLSSTEERIIRQMLVRYYGPDTVFLDRVPNLRFETRHLTGTGYYLSFLTAASENPIDAIDDELTENFTTRLSPPADSVGFTLFIRKGHLSSFEGYTFGDVRWPDAPIEQWISLVARERRSGQTGAAAAPQDPEPIRSEELLRLLRDYPEGLSREQILRYFNPKGDQTAEADISNMLDMLKRGNEIVKYKDKYRSSSLLTSN